MKNSEKNFAILNDYFAIELPKADEDSQFGVDASNFQLKETGAFLYKGKTVISYYLNEGTATSRMDFGNHRDESAFLRRALRETRELMTKPEETI